MPILYIPIGLVALLVIRTVYKARQRDAELVAIFDKKVEEAKQAELRG